MFHCIILKEIEVYNTRLSTKQLKEVPWSAFIVIFYCIIPDSKVHGANMGPIWGRQDQGGSHVGPLNFAIWDAIVSMIILI